MQVPIHKGYSGYKSRSDTSNPPGNLASSVRYSNPVKWKRTRRIPWLESCICGFGRTYTELFVIYLIKKLRHWFSCLGNQAHKFCDEATTRAYSGRNPLVDGLDALDDTLDSGDVQDVFGNSFPESLQSVLNAGHLKENTNKYRMFHLATTGHIFE